MTGCTTSLASCEAGPVRRFRELSSLFNQPVEVQLADPEVYAAAREEHYAEVRRKPHYQDLVGPIDRITHEQIDRALRRLVAQAGACTAPRGRPEWPWERRARGNWRPCTEAT